MIPERGIAYKGFKIREMRQDDLPAVACLAREIFHYSRSVDALISQFSWKFFRNPLGERTSAVIEDTDGNIVAFIAAIPVRLKLGCSIETLHQGVACGVDIRHRNSGLLGEMLSFCGEMFREKYDAPVTYGFPNTAAYDIGHKKYGYIRFATIPQYELPLSVEGFLRMLPRRTCPQRGMRRLYRTINSFLPACRFYRKSSRLSSVSVKRVLHLPDDYDSFWGKVSEQYTNCAVKDSLFARWRFFEEPYSTNHFYEVRREGELVGYFVLSQDTMFRLLDWMVYREKSLIEEVFVEILRVASSYAHRHVLTIVLVQNEMTDVILTYRPMETIRTAVVYTNFCESEPTEIFTKLTHEDWHISDALFGLG